MKIQIRQGVFETNSSSVHTITISDKKVHISNYTGTTLVFGKNRPYTSIYYAKGNEMQSKLDDIFIYMCSNDSLSNFIRCKQKIEDVFSKYDIKCEFNLELLYTDDYYPWSEYANVFDKLFDVNNKDFESDLISFIFNKDSKCNAYDNNYYDRDKLDRSSKIFESLD